MSSLGCFLGLRCTTRARASHGAPARPVAAAGRGVDRDHRDLGDAFRGHARVHHSRPDHHLQRAGHGRCPCSSRWWWSASGCSSSGSAARGLAQPAARRGDHRVAAWPACTTSGMAAMKMPGHGPLQQRRWWSCPCSSPSSPGTAALWAALTAARRVGHAGRVADHGRGGERDALHRHGGHVRLRTRIRDARRDVRRGEWSGVPAAAHHRRDQPPRSPSP